MFKKLFIAAAVLAVLIFAAVIVIQKVAGPSDGARLVPEETVFFASFVDLPRSFFRWQSTALAQIGKEPEVRAFLEKPLASLQSNPGAGETGKILGGIKPGRIFLAVTEVSKESVDALIGFQYWGSHQEFDAAVARMRQELPPGEITREKYDGNEIVICRHGKFATYSVTLGRWGFVATNGDLIKSALDRTAGRQKTPSLADGQRFQAVSKKMLAAPDFFFFLQPQKVIDVLLETGRSLGAESIPEQVEDLRATEAVGGSLKLDGELQRDALFLLRKGAKPAESLTHKTSCFTGSETVVFIDFLARFSGLPALLEKALADAAPQAAIVEFAGLAASAFGPECALIVNWGPGQMTPSGVLAAEIRNPGKAGEALKKLITFFPETRIVDDEGILLYSIPSVSNPLASPTLTLTDRFLLLGIEASSVSRAARAKGPELEGLPAFAPAIPAYHSANEVFAFVDTNAIFERAYTALRPVIHFWAQVMPVAAEMIDTGKLPQTETISRHLQPVILSQQRLEDGVLMESSGPITASEMAIAAAAGGIFSASKGPAKP
ncbi:MAG: hypothetical protein ACOYM3_05335 [Terrimicrobiaceae bacterium]